MSQYIFGHRGASGYAPENTLEAFELAAKMGAHGVELDVHICKSGELVVAHDETIDRVADGTGFIKDMTPSELKSHHFNKTHPEYKDAFEAMPCNSGYFMCVKPKGVDAELLRQKLISDYSTGTIMLSGLIRVAFSAVPTEKLGKLFENIYNCIKEMK